MGLLWLDLPLFDCAGFKEFGEMGLNTYTKGIKDFHRSWSGSLAKRRLCLGPAGVINCTPLSTLSFWVGLFPRTHGYNKVMRWSPHEWDSCFYERATQTRHSASTVWGLRWFQTQSVTDIVSAPCDVHVSEHTSKTNRMIILDNVPTWIIENIITSLQILESWL